MRIDEKPGWWKAHDGNWYPPELQPDHPTDSPDDGTGTLSAQVRPLGPRSRFERLRFGGSCVNCGTKIDPDEEGWRDPDIDRHICADCWPSVVGSHPSAAGRSGGPGRGARMTTVAGPSNPPGPSETRERQGGAVVDLMSVRLRCDLGERAVVLTDRTVPGSTTSIDTTSTSTASTDSASTDGAPTDSDSASIDGVSIDTVVVASSGVWIVASKRVDGVIDVRAVSGSPSREPRLLIGGRDRTAMAERLWEYVVPVAKLVNDPTVPVQGAIAMVEADWGGPTRLLSRRPHRHEGVWILWPAALIKKIEEPGPLGPGEIRSIGARLEAALPSR